MDVSNDLNQEKGKTEEDCSSEEEPWAGARNQIEIQLGQNVINYRQCNRELRSLNQVILLKSVHISVHLEGVKKKIRGWRRTEPGMVTHIYVWTHIFM